MQEPHTRSEGPVARYVISIVIVVCMQVLVHPGPRVGFADDEAARARARELISQLSEPRFAVRERATQELIELGPSILREVQRGTRHSDLEVRARCRKIVRVVAARDRDRRLEAFLAGTEMLDDYPLPGWQRLREVTGDSQIARQLMVDMLREDWQLWQAVEDGREDATSAVVTRCAELQAARYRHRQLATMPRMATVVLLAVGGHSALPDETVNAVFSLLNQVSSRSDKLPGDPWQDGAFRKLVGKLIAGTSGAGTAYQCFNLALRKEFSEALIPAERMINATAPVHIRQFAVLTIARFGSTEQVPALEELLDDHAVCYKRAHPQTQKLVFECQLRDVALATLIHLSGQDPKKFGFQQLQSNPQFVFQPYTVGFSSDEQRRSAYQKWKAFRTLTKAS